MKTTEEKIEDAEMVGVIADIENRKSKWVKAEEVQKHEHETMDVEITGVAEKRVEAYQGDPKKTYTKLEVPVRDLDGEERIVTLSGQNILRVVKGDGKYPGLGYIRKTWVGNKLRLKAVSSDKAKSGYGLQIFPLLLLGRKANRPPNTSKEELLEAFE